MEIDRSRIEEVESESIIEIDRSRIIPIGPAGEVGEISTITGKEITASETSGLIKETVEDVKENWPVYGGAAIGGITGGIPGAALGGAAGEAYKQIGQQIKGSEKAPQTPLEAGGRIVKQGLTMGAYEVGGRIIAGAAGKILAPFKGRVTPEGEVAKKIFDKYMPKETSWRRPLSKLFGMKKVGVLPAEATEHYGLDIMNNVAEGSVIGGKTISDFKNIVRKETIEGITDDLVNSFGKQANSNELGGLIADTVTLNWRNFKDNITAPLYKKAEELAEKVTVPTKSLKKAIEGQLKIAREIGSIEAKNSGDDLARAISELPDTVEFGVAKDLRSRLLSVINEFSITNKNAPALRISNQLINKLDDSITTSLKNQNPAAHDIWRKANSLYREGSQKYNTRFLRGLVKKADPDFGGEPEKVLSMIFKKGGVSTVNKVKNAIGENQFSKLKAWHVRDLVNKSIKDEILNGEMLEKRMFGPTGIGKEAINAIYTQTEQNSLKNIATALKTVQKKQAAGGGAFLVQITQAGAIVGLATGQFQASMGTILIGPEVMAKMMLNPVSSKWLTTGLLTVPKSAGSVIAAMGRATKFIEQFTDYKFTKEMEEGIKKRFERKTND